MDDSFLEEIREGLPELPVEKKQRFIKDFGLSTYDADVLTASRELADYFEAVAAVSGVQSKLAANWVTGELTGMLNKENKEILESPVSADMLGGLLQRIADNTISGKIAKTVFEAMWNGEGDAGSVIEKKGLKQITDTGAIEKIIDEILVNNPSQLEEYRAGKEKLFGFFVGQAMKATKGKANPAQVNQILKDKLKG